MSQLRQTEPLQDRLQECRGSKNILLEEVRERKEMLRYRIMSLCRQKGLNGFEAEEEEFDDDVLVDVAGHFTTMSHYRMIQATELHEQ